MLQLEEYEKIKGELSRKRLDGSKGGFHRLPKSMMTKWEKEVADRENYEYNMVYLFDYIAVKYFKVSGFCNIPNYKKKDIMQRIMIEDINFTDYFSMIDTMYKNDKFTASLEYMHDGRLRYTIRGSDYVYSIKIDFGSLQIMINSSKNEIVYNDPIRLYEKLNKKGKIKYNRQYMIDKGIKK